MFAGLVNLHKPCGLTSRQAVDRVKRLVWPAKAGHAGTLDPLASGVLVVAVGPATRLIEYVQAMPKRYVGAFLLGRESNTEDIEGEVRLLAEAPRPAEDEVRAAAARFVGQIQQRPPAFSALKLQGRRAYDLARAGQPVSLAARPVMVHSLDVVRYSYPELVLEIECGSGTYIRSLGRDLAESLGTASVMSALVRTAIGCFQLEDARSPEQLGREDISEWLESPLRALPTLPKVTLPASDVVRVCRGQSIHRAIDLGKTEVAAVDDQNELVAILVAQPGGALRPVRNFAQGVPHAGMSEAAPP